MARKVQPKLLGLAGSAWVWLQYRTAALFTPAGSRLISLPSAGRNEIVLVALSITS